MKHKLAEETDPHPVKGLQVRRYSQSHNCQHGICSELFWANRLKGVLLPPRSSTQHHAAKTSANPVSEAEIYISGQVQGRSECRRRSANHDACGGTTASSRKHCALACQHAHANRICSNTRSLHIQAPSQTHATNSSAKLLFPLSEQLIFLHFLFLRLQLQIGT